MYRSASFRRHKCSRTTDPGVSLTLNPRLFISLAMARFTSLRTPSGRDGAVEVAGCTGARLYRRHKCSRTTDPGVSLTLNPRLLIRSLRLASRPYGRHPGETERWWWRWVRTKTQGCVPYQGPGVSLTLNPRLLIRSLRLASRPVGRHPDETERWWGGWWVQKNSDGGLAHRYFFWGWYVG